MSKIKYFLFFLILVLCPTTFCIDVNVTNTITSPNNSTQGRYSGTEIYNTGTTNVYSVNTRYNGQLSRIRYNLPLPSELGECFATNTTYTITMNMATEDWRNKFGSVYVGWGSGNTNWATGNVTYVSYKKIYFKFKIPATDSNCYDFVFVDLKSSNISNTAFTGVSNWNLSKVTLTDPVISSGGSSGGSNPTPTPTNDYSSIINNQNQNTQDIIENNSQNTQDIIENNNTNTEKIIENQNELLGEKCPNEANFNYDEDNPITINALFNDSYVYTGKYIHLKGGTTYYLNYKRASNIDDYNTFEIILMDDRFDTDGFDYLLDFQGSQGTSLSFTPRYTGDYQLRVDCNFEGSVCAYYDFYISEVNEPYCPFGSYKSKLDTGNSIAQDTNNYLKDNSNPNIDDSELTGVIGSVGYSDPLSYLLQLPTLLINQLVSQSNSCQVVNLGTLWGVNISLPCLDIGSYIGTDVWNTIDILFAIGLLVNIFKNLYHTFANLLTLGAEKEAREKFNMPTPMDFLSSILGGGK